LENPREPPGIGHARLACRECTLRITVTSPMISTRTGMLIGPTNRLNLGIIAWIAMFFSILIWKQTNLPSGELGDSTNYTRIVAVMFAAAASVWVLLHNAARLRYAFSGPLLLLLFYALVAMVSSAYVPAYAFYSMWKGFEVLVDVLVIAAILSYPAALSSARTAYRVLPFLDAILVVVFLIEAVTMPSLALSPTRGYISVYMSGVMPNMSQNALAFLSAVSAFALVCRLYRPGRVIVKLFYLSVLCLALMALIFAQSRTSVIALALALLVYLIFDRRFLSLALFAGVLLIAAMYTQASDVSVKYLLRGQDAELVTTLSGRTEGWEAAWASFQESPIVGQGFAAYARAHILGTTGLSSLHGAFFDVLVGTGLLGLLPWIAAIGWTLLRLFSFSWSRHPWFRSAAGRSFQAEMLGVMVLILVRASTSSGLAMHEDNFMLFLAVLAYTTAMRHAARRGWSDTSLTSLTAAKA
jgi:O-antigen ligase